MATDGWTTCGFGGGGRIAKYQIQAATAAAGITTIAAPRTVSLIRMKNPRPSARTIFPHASAIVEAARKIPVAVATTARPAPRIVAVLAEITPSAAPRSFSLPAAIVRATAGRNLFSRTGFGRTSVLARVLVGGGAGTGAGF